MQLFRFIVVGLLVAFGMGNAACAQEQPQLGITDTIRLSASDFPGGVLQVEESRDFLEWRPFAVTHDRLVDFPDFRWSDTATRFYRLRIQPRSPTDDWKNQIAGFDDSFRSPMPTGETASRWIKFIIDLDAPHRVIFQDSAKYAFHYDFATARLDRFLGVDPLEFDRMTLLADGQKAVLGAIVISPDPKVPEIGIQFAGDEPFPVARVLGWFDLVRAFINAPGETQFFYFPSFEQSAVTTANLARFTDRGIPVDSAARWIQTDQCYSDGWAFGRVVFVKTEWIHSAYAEGKLRDTDILFTDRVPAEIPPVAGVITTSPATPNSHVAILSRSFGIPFVHVARADEQQRILAWDGQEMILLAETTSGQCSVSAFNVEGQLSTAQRTRLMQAKQTPPLSVVPFEKSGKWSIAMDAIAPDDIRFVGGKAANFVLLRRSLPDNSPDPAIAFTFDLWSAFLDQPLAGGKTLRSTISDKLAPYTFPPGNVSTLQKDLAEIRSLITGGADFSPEQKTSILGALHPFEERRKIRFRSSTNVEDSDFFVGAGLYDSFSGCVLDDTDGDDQGPSHCDPSKPGERGVFRALRRVYASFYNDNAFLERLRHGIDEATVGMAVLVHDSFPDELELANGVATLQVTKSDPGQASGFQMAGELVTQAGAASVANPDGNALPEVLHVTHESGLDAALRIERRSSLVPLGGTVLEWEREYRDLTALLERAAAAYFSAKPDKSDVVLDYEYKKILPGKLVVKQIRELPQARNSQQAPPFILNDIGQLEVFQHHGKDLFANHRLKSIWNFKALQFEGETIGDKFDFITSLEHHDGQSVLDFNGTMSLLPDSTFRVQGSSLTYGWSFGQGNARRTYQLNISFANNIENQTLIALGEATLIELSVDYATPQPRLKSIDSGSLPTIEKIRSEKTRLVPLGRVIDRTMRRNQEFKQGKITVSADYALGIFKFPAPGIGIFDGKSFPLVRWNRPTRIEGLTSQPIELNNHFSRTYDSSRHNFAETFLFVPHLDPAVDPETLAELRDKNIHGLLVSQWTAFGGVPQMFIWGMDDTIRNAAAP